MRSTQQRLADLEAQVSLLRREIIAPPGRDASSMRGYPLANIVQVHHGSGSAGDTKAANADGYHPGRVKRMVSGTLTTIETCWIRFVDTHDSSSGNIDAIEDDYYGPARLGGLATSGGSTLPLYLVRKGGESTTTTTSSIPFRNDSGESCPPGAVMEITGVADVSGTPHITITKPSAEFPNHYSFVINTGTSSVANGATGTCVWGYDDWKYVAYNNAATPAANDEWGPAPGSWLLHQYRLGFHIQGGATTVGGQAVVKAKQEPIRRVFARLKADLQQGGFALARIYYVTSANERVEAGYNDISVYDLMMNKDEEIEEDTWIIAEWYNDEWRVVQAYCSKDDTGTQSAGQSPNLYQGFTIFGAPDSSTSQFTQQIAPAPIDPIP